MKIKKSPKSRKIKNNAAEGPPSAQKNLNIAMFTNNYYPFIGGVPVSINRQAAGLRKCGHTVHIFAPLYPGQKTDADEHVHRYKLLVFYKSKVFHYAVANIFSPKIERDFIKNNFDVVHVHHPFWMGKKGMKLGKKYNIPVILTYHTRFDCYYHYVPFMKQAFKRIISHRMVKNFAGRCSAVFSPMETSREYLLGLNISKPIVVLPTGLDYEGFNIESDKDLREQLVPSGGVLLCSVSRLSREKNIYFIIDCLKYIKSNTHTLFKCVIIGDGPEKGEIINAIDAAGLADECVLLGRIPPEEVCKYYLVSDIFIFASKTETQGLVLLEAMAGGCPVVAVSSGGVDDIVTDGHNGYKTREDVREWSERVIHLFNDRDEYDRMSENASRFAEGFSLENMAVQASEIYREIINNHSERERA